MTSPILPIFPHFKKVERSDQAAVESIAHAFPPYSDFNFPVLWSWDLHRKSRVSQLYGNLVLELQDFREEGITYTFLGNNRPNATLDTLFTHIREEQRGEASVGLVPENSIVDIDLSQYGIAIDFNACDYMYDLVSLVTFPGNKFYKKRKRLTTFLQNGTGIETLILDLSDHHIQREILVLTEKWAKNKMAPDDDINLFLSKEYKAMDRFMAANFSNAVCLGVRSQGELVGLNMLITVADAYAIGLFVKYDKSFVGINEYLMSKGAELLLQKGCRFVNGQEDLGIIGLRTSKNSYKPIYMLRKYTITKL